MRGGFRSIKSSCVLAFQSKSKEDYGMVEQVTLFLLVRSFRSCPTVITSKLMSRLIDRVIFNPNIFSGQIGSVISLDRIDSPSIVILSIKKEVCQLWSYYASLI